MSIFDARQMRVLTAADSITRVSLAIAFARRMGVHEVADSFGAFGVGRITDAIVAPRQQPRLSWKSWTSARIPMGCRLTSVGQKTKGLRGH